VAVVSTEAAVTFTMLMASRARSSASCRQVELNQRRCPGCNLFARRVDHEGLCPHCDEPVAVQDLAVTREEASATG